MSTAVARLQSPQNSSSSSSSSSSIFSLSSSSHFYAALLAGAAAAAATAATATSCSNNAECSSAIPSISSNASLDAAMGKLRTQFSCPTMVLNNLASRMNVEMEKGLMKTEGSAIKMLPSFVKSLPTGQETGEFLALDLGGSNFRVVTFRLEANKGVQLIESRKVTIPKALMTNESSAKDLFGFIADQVGKAPGAKDASTPKLNLGFTFSFPVDQKSINSGILLHWTKGFATRNCVGEEIVELLQKELVSREIDVNVSALVNDTVGTLVANTLDDPDTHVGVILGTGCNACYTEKVTNILKMENTSGNQDDEMVREVQD
jgi:hexokinase